MPGSAATLVAPWLLFVCLLGMAAGGAAENSPWGPFAPPRGHRPTAASLASSLSSRLAPSTSRGMLRASRGMGPLWSAGGNLERLRGGFAAGVQIQRSHSFVSSTVEAEKGEVLSDHKAALRARSKMKGGTRPMLLQRLDSIEAAERAESAGQGKTLSLVRPNYDSEDEDEAQEVEDGKKFEAFKGTAHVMLTPEQVKMSTPSQMHRLAIARLSRMNQRMSDAQEGTTKEKTEEEHQKMVEKHLKAPPPAQRKEADLADFTPEYADKETLEGKEQGIDEEGREWMDNWGVDAKGLKHGRKEGFDWRGSWEQVWTEVSKGRFVMQGSNEQGHRWGERWGTYANGTSYKERWLIKEDEAYEERSGWLSEGQTSGFRKGKTEDGMLWQEEWLQQVQADGVSIGRLAGANEHGEVWREEWEVVPLDAFDSITGEQLTSACGEKSGTDRQGMAWTQSWGADDIHGRWGTRSERTVDGSEWTEHWGANTEGDIWCEKWGLTQCDLGVVQEWGNKCGQKNVRIGEEMDGVTNTEEGKQQTWTETWCKTFEADGRMARTQAEKHGENGFGDKWVEKWDEVYEKEGMIHKWASKVGKKDVTNDEWKEEWGEKREKGTEEHPDGRMISCWAERTGSNGYGDVWRDAWSEDLNPFTGAGGKVCNKWKRYGTGVEVVERSGEEWDGKGWFQKGGEMLQNGNKVSGWHDRAW